MRTPIIIREKFIPFFHGMEVEAFEEDGKVIIQSKDAKYSIYQRGKLSEPYLFDRCCEIFEETLFKASLPGFLMRLKNVADEDFKSTLYHIETEWERWCLTDTWTKWVNREIQLRLLTKKL